MPDLVAQHLEELRSNGFSESTIASAAGWLQNLQSFAGQRSLTELGPKDLEQWHKELSWTPGPKGGLYAANTINQAVGAVRRFYRLLLADGPVMLDPTAGIRTPKSKASRKKPTLSSSQARRLLSAPDLDTPMGVRDRAILGVLLETQISAEACSGIDLSHLCFDTGALLTSGRGQSVHSLGDGLLADLERYLQESRPLLVSLEEPEEALFLTVQGTRLKGPRVGQLYRKYR